MSFKSNKNFVASFDDVATRRKESFQNKLAAANQRISELEALVAQKKVSKIPINLIKPNLDQPRKSFHDIEQMANLLLLQGQKEPIILVKTTEVDKYIIFDGERRYRAHLHLGWKEINAIIIPYSEETFQEDVLVAALNKSSINALDEAEAIVKNIQQQITLESTEIADKLLSFISFTRRGDRLEYLKKLGNLESREECLKKLDFRDEIEKIICLTIANLGRSCISISSNRFPLLKLAPDLKIAIREKGLNERIALNFNSLNPQNKKLKGMITEKKAVILRNELITKALINEWTTREASEALKNIISEITGNSKESVVKNYVDYLNRINLKVLNRNDKDLLLSNLHKLIAKIESSQ